MARKNTDLSMVPIHRLSEKNAQIHGKLRWVWGLGTGDWDWKRNEFGTSSIMSDLCLQSIIHVYKQ